MREKGVKEGRRIIRRNQTYRTAESAEVGIIPTQRTKLYRILSRKIDDAEYAKRGVENESSRPRDEEISKEKMEAHINVRA